MSITLLYHDRRGGQRLILRTVRIRMITTRPDSGDEDDIGEQVLGGVPRDPTVKCSYVKFPSVRGERESGGRSPPEIF